MTKKEWIQLKQKAKTKDSEAEWTLASIYKEGIIKSENKISIKPNLKKAFYWYKLSAEHGNSAGQLCLGYCYDLGVGTMQNKDKAMLWYKKALKNGETAAANNIATVYRDRNNNQRAFFWFKRAVELKDDDALIELGVRYYKGVGVRKNSQKAIDCFQEAIVSQNITQASREDAMYYLGIAYFEGKGVLKNISKANRLI